MEVTILESVVVEPLAFEERAEFIELEQKAESAMKQTEDSFREFGGALHQIHERRLYRGQHKTFEAYVRTRWDMPPARAYQIIDARNTFKLLAPIVEITTERAARELAPLTDDEKIKAGQELAKSDAPVTSTRTKSAAMKVSKKKRDMEAARENRAKEKAAKAMATVLKKEQAKQAKAEKKRIKIEKTENARKAKQQTPKPAKIKPAKPNAASSDLEARIASLPPGNLMRRKLEAELVKAQTGTPSEAPAIDRLIAWLKANRDKLNGNSIAEIISKVQARVL